MSSRKLLLQTYKSCSWWNSRSLLAPSWNQICNICTVPWSHEVLNKKDISLDNIPFHPSLSFFQIKCSEQVEKVENDGGNTWSDHPLKVKPHFIPVQSSFSCQLGRSEVVVKDTSRKKSMQKYRSRRSVRDVKSIYFSDREVSSQPKKRVTVERPTTFEEMITVSAKTLLDVSPFSQRSGRGTEKPLRKGDVIKKVAKQANNEMKCMSDSSVP